MVLHRMDHNFGGEVVFFHQFETKCKKFGISSEERVFYTYYYILYIIYVFTQYNITSKFNLLRVSLAYFGMGKKEKKMCVCMHMYIYI